MSTHARRLLPSPSFETDATVTVLFPRRELPALRREPAWPLIEDLAGGLTVLGAWVALWSWFLAATW